LAGKNDFYITDADKEWVHKSFEWLIKSYGYPKPDFIPILLTEQFFPLTIAHKQTAVEPLLADLCSLFKIDTIKISYEIEEDIRDTHGTPYELHGTPFECDLEFIKLDNGYHYKLFFAKSLLKTPKRLVFNAVFQFIQIRLSQTDIEWIRSEEHYFIFYLIGIYTGWGVLLAQTMIDIGREHDMFWERSWKYISPMPIPVMAYGMALHSAMIEKKEPVWKNFLPPDIRVQYEKAVEYISRNPSPVFNKQELMANALFKEACQHTQEKDFDSAIETYQKAIFLTQDDYLKSTIYNNIGYTLECKGDFEKSIPFFQKALEFNSKASYANDNLSFAFIMLGDMDTGKYYHSIAAQTGKSIKAYSYRNLAMYHQKRGEIEKARQNFQKAFENITIPVDWLEYLYARFLFEQGEKEEALVYLQMAVEKGEPQAIQWMNEINKPV
jgi:tetratricopeptide (TPR) repeat protein